MADRYQLQRDGKVLAEHSTRGACITEAVERKLMVYVAEVGPRLVPGVEIVKIALCAERRDSFGRLLGRLWLDGLDLSAWLLDEGLASPYP